MLFNCRTMRAAVMMSGLLLAAGVLLGLIAVVTPFSVPTSQLSLMLVLASALLLAVTFIAALVPGAARRMDECQH
jgi:hypothetical protein